MQVTEVARINGVAYGVAFVVCSNGEVARLALGLDDEDEALEKMRSAANAIIKAGYDYERCGDFRAYNGGPRVWLVDPVYYVADLSYEGDVEPSDDECDREDWRVTWQRGAGATPIPAEVEAKVDAVIAAATK